MLKTNGTNYIQTLQIQSKVYKVSATKANKVSATKLSKTLSTYNSLELGAMS